MTNPEKTQKNPVYTGKMRVEPAETPVNMPINPGITAKIKEKIRRIIRKIREKYREIQVKIRKIQGKHPENEGDTRD